MIFLLFPCMGSERCNWGVQACPVYLLDLVVRLRDVGMAQRRGLPSR